MDLKLRAEATANITKTTEHDKLMAMNESESVYNNSRAKYIRKLKDHNRHHPSVYGKSVPKWYYCHKCGKYGDHFEGFCQVIKRVQFIPLHKRMAPSGIPSNLLRAATAKEAETVAMRTADGRFVMRISE